MYCATCLCTGLQRNSYVIPILCILTSPREVELLQQAGLSLKTDERSHGDYTESQLYQMTTDIYSYVF